VRRRRCSRKWKTSGAKVLRKFFREKEVSNLANDSLKNPQKLFDKPLI